MHGPEAAAEAITQLLAAKLPAKTDELLARLEPARLDRAARARWHPKLIASFDVLDLPLDSFPAFLVVATSASRVRRVDVARDPAHAGHAVYLVTYRLAVYTWAAAPVGDHATPADRGQAADVMRKRLVLAVRETLLSNLAMTVTLGAGLNDAGEPVTGSTVHGAIDDTTWTEAYSDVEDEQGGTVAAARTEFDLTLEEAVPARPAPPTAERVEVITHPALAP